MSFIRYKTFGKKRYAYEITSYWDPELKKPRQKSVYLGVLDELTGEVKKLERARTESGIVDFGDGYALCEVAKESGLFQVINESCKEHETILCLMLYQIIAGGAMCHAAEWASGNIAGKLFCHAKLKSQDISRLFKYLGQETVQREFFKHYVSRFFTGKKGLLIDSTALSSAINSSLNAWGYSAEGISEHVSCIMLVDQESKLPIYFRAVSGDIPDVSVLRHTLDEITRLGIEADQAIFDAGFYSGKNIQLLCDRGINFITRLPKSRTLFKTLTDNLNDLESRRYATSYGERILFIREIPIRLCDTDMYAYVILDPDKKAKDTKLLLREALEETDNEEAINLQLKKSGLFVLISTTPMPISEVLPAYYTRQNIEQIFSFAKSGASLLPLRVHSTEAMNGYLMLMFMALTLFILAQQKLRSKFSMEYLLVTLRNLKAKVYPDEIIPQELNKKNKALFEQLSIIVPKNLGI